MKQKQLNKRKLKINYGKAINFLPVWDDARLTYEIKHNKRVIIVINDIVCFVILYL